MTIVIAKQGLQRNAVWTVIQLSILDFHSFYSHSSDWQWIRQVVCQQHHSSAYNPQKTFGPEKVSMTKKHQIFYELSMSAKRMPSFETLPSERTIKMGLGWMRFVMSSRISLVSMEQWWSTICFDLLVWFDIDRLDCLSDLILWFLNHTQSLSQLLQN